MYIWIDIGVKGSVRALLEVLIVEQQIQGAKALEVLNVEAAPRCHGSSLGVPSTGVSGSFKGAWA